MDLIQAYGIRMASSRRPTAFFLSPPSIRSASLKRRIIGRLWFSTRGSSSFLLVLETARR